ncbi:MAG: hypothetical protein QOK39_2764 [Acidimicrobiaceae bacterium]|nr:hypothetical protein [Acidimicrobiaceae bacterium]
MIVLAGFWEELVLASGLYPKPFTRSLILLASPGVDVPLATSTLMSCGARNAAVAVVFEDLTVVPGPVAPPTEELVWDPDVAVVAVPPTLTGVAPGLWRNRSAPTTTAAPMSSAARPAWMPVERANEPSPAA